MTENKRFYIKQSESTGEYPVFDRLNDDECVAVNDVERISQKTCDLLNQLSDENEQLKQRIKVLEDTIDGLTGTIAHFDLDEVIGND